MPSWYLLNVEPVAREHKYTFYKPSPEVLDKVVVGDIVKLVFEFESDDPKAPHAERMWVKVESIGGDGTYGGVLDNDPRYIQDLKCGDAVRFETCHVINTEYRDPANDIVEKYSQRCFVTNRVLKDGAPVGYVYREPPEEENDSGWRMTANDESDEYMDDAENCAYVSVGAVLNCDDSFVALLDAEVGAAFVRDEASGEFVALQFEE